MAVLLSSHLIPVVVGVQAHHPGPHRAEEEVLRHHHLLHHQGVAVGHQGLTISSCRTTETTSSSVHQTVATGVKTRDLDVSVSSRAEGTCRTKPSRSVQGSRDARHLFTASAEADEELFTRLRCSLTTRHHARLCLAGTPFARVRANKDPQCQGLLEADVQGADARLPLQAIFQGPSTDVLVLIPDA